jgi:hypothetical protein
LIDPVPREVLPFAGEWAEPCECEPGVAVAPGVAVEPGVEVAVGASDGVLVGSAGTVVWTGEGYGEGSAVCVAAGVDVGASVGVSVGAVVGTLVAVVSTVAVASGVGEELGSCPRASAPSDAAKRAAPARPVARMRRVKIKKGVHGAPPLGRAGPLRVGIAPILLEFAGNRSGLHPTPGPTAPTVSSSGRA